MLDDPPVSPPTRIRAALHRRLRMIRHRGDAVQCPLCGHAFDAFQDAWNRPDAICWRCGSHERHRFQALLFERRPDLLATTGALLHFAPEYCLRRILSADAERRGARYVTTDLEPEGVDVQLDLTRLDLPDDAFDAAICSHVLEHIPDDAAAMRELRRVIRPGGWCLVMVPLDTGRERTYEDPAITTPEARQAAFLQHDHVRLYAPDIEGRLTAAGFAVEVLRPRAMLGDDAVRRARLLESDWAFLCR